MQTITDMTAILVLAALAEALVEFLVAPIVDSTHADPIPPDTLNWPPLALRYTAVAVGVALSLCYRTDLLQLFGLVPPLPWVGYIITGLVIGRGSNFVHDFAGRWLTQPPLD